MLTITQYGETMASWLIYGLLVFGFAVVMWVSYVAHKMRMAATLADEFDRERDQDANPDAND
jgi:hypothetical protein